MTVFLVMRNFAEEEMGARSLVINTCSPAVLLRPACCWMASGAERLQRRGAAWMYEPSPINFVSDAPEESGRGCGTTQQQNNIARSRPAQQNPLLG